MCELHINRRAYIAHSGSLLCGNFIEIIFRGIIMYAELKMELKTENLTYKKSSNLQGVIMEHIDPDYASVLHRNQQNPYSQCLIHEKEKDKCFWYIRTITREAYENMILPMSELKSFGLKNINGDITDFI